MKYLLTCTACGNQVPVSTGQAGQTIHCPCGAANEVPSIRELRNLEVAEVESEAAPAWGRRQGLFFLGGAIAALALLAIGTLQLLKPKLIDVNANLPTVDPVAVQKEIEAVAPDENYMRYESVRPWPPRLFAERYEKKEVPAYLLPSANLLARFEYGGAQFLADSQTRPIREKIQLLNFQNRQAQVKRWQLDEWIVIATVVGAVGLAVAISGLFVRGRAKKPPSRARPATVSAPRN
jgi:hypothetical protein